MKISYNLYYKGSRLKLSCLQDLNQRSVENLNNVRH
jgi:hypothetical protein